MPWHRKPKKDADSCEKLRGVAHRQRAAGIRMGKPGGENLRQRILNT